MQFASAAFIGIAAGTVLYVISTLLSSILGLYDEEEPTSELSRPPTADSQSSQLLKKDESSSYESDWQMLAQSPNMRKKRSPGLLSQTIHEEDDDSE